LKKKIIILIVFLLIPNITIGLSKKNDLLIGATLGATLCGITSYHCLERAYQRFFQPTINTNENSSKSKFLNYAAAAGYTCAGTLSGIATIGCIAQAILIMKVLKE